MNFKRTLLALAATALTLPALAVDTVSWTTWTSTSAGSFMQNGHTVNVSYAGSVNAVDTWENVYDITSSFTNAVVTNTPTQANGTLQVMGGNQDVNVLTFSQAVINPVIDVFSLGQPGLPVSFNFLLGAGQSFTIGASGAGHWGGGTLTQSGNSITGWEGNGLLQFTGTFNKIEFTTPNYEYYYGFTVGAMSSVNAVPEPETYALMLAGLGVIASVARRRKARA